MYAQLIFHTVVPALRLLAGTAYGGLDPPDIAVGQRGRTIVNE
jgi:hypothetical protein